MKEEKERKKVIRSNYRLEIVDYIALTEVYYLYKITECPGKEEEEEEDEEDE